MKEHTKQNEPGSFAHAAGRVEQENPPEQVSPASPAPQAPSAASKAPQTPDQKVGELTDMLKRLQADFENHVKQADKRQAQMAEHASATVLLKILNVVDDFELVYKTLKDANIDPKLLEGMGMVNKNLHGLLEHEGVRAIHCIGKKLDPFKQEVLRRVKKEGTEDDTIVEEHVKGYMLKDKVLRYSKVTVVQNGGN